MRRRRLLLAILLSVPSGLVLAMLLGWRFGPVRDVGHHRIIRVEVTGSVVDARTGLPIADAWVSDSPTALLADDPDGAAFITRLVASFGRDRGTIPAVYGSAADCTDAEGTFLVAPMGFWDLSEPSYGLRLGPDPSPTPYDVVRTLVVEAVGYEPRAFSLRRFPWKRETTEVGGPVFVMNVGELRIRPKN